MNFVQKVSSQARQLDYSKLDSLEIKDRVVAELSRDGYRLLNIGEWALVGDEYLSSWSGEWNVLAAPQLIKRCSVLYRSKITGSTS